MYTVPQYFDCATLRITKPAATGRVYTKGSMTVTGTKSPQDARLAVQKLCSVIQSAGFEVDQATVDAVSGHIPGCHIAVHKPATPGRAGAEGTMGDLGKVC
jgi:TATA-box binding protein (TBP) (component of TFIID and TFIIIB)